MAIVFPDVMQYIAVMLRRCTLYLIGEPKKKKVFFSERKFREESVYGLSCKCETTTYFTKNNFRVEH